MDIKVGDYIRTTDGIIGKVVDTFTNIYPEPWEIVLDNGIDLHEEDLANRDIQIKSHSENLIDLIDTGDYINGYKVIHIDREAPNNVYEGIELDMNNNYEYQFIAKNKIKSILTKEQYEQNCYKVEE